MVSLFDGTDHNRRSRFPNVIVEQLPLAYHWVGNRYKAKNVLAVMYEMTSLLQLQLWISVSKVVNKRNNPCRSRLKFQLMGINETCRKAHLYHAMIYL